MAKRYSFEKEGQIAFFEHFGISEDTEEGVKLINSTDGIYKGTIFEFKLSINDYNAVLKQAIKYLSRRRVLGHSVPKNILLISLNTEEAYWYDSNKFLNEIEQIYIGAASKENKDFITKIKPRKIVKINDRSNGLKQIEKIIDDESFTKINIDEHCVIGWAERFYLENKRSSKSDFFNEIKNPRKFKDFIYPWKGKEIDFKYIMDCLNDPQHKKELGAFYTPKEYCKLAVNFVREAISKVPKGNDYVIIDRCAGTGNLEVCLSDEELSHTIVSTYELKEWEVLYKRIGDKVRIIIPPKPNHKDGLVVGGDALAQSVFEECKEYIKNPKCTVILFENPPYRDERSSSNGAKQNVKSTFVKKQMQNDDIKGQVIMDLSNQFIWSGFKFYLTKKTDSYILFSPIKYWKWHDICNKHFNNGFLFNKKHFHATTPSAISCIHWQNITANIDTIKLRAFDISEEFEQAFEIKESPIIIRKIFSNFNKVYYDKRKFKDDRPNGLCCEYNGYETKRRHNVYPIRNDNIIGCLRASSVNLDANSRNITRFALYDGNGFYLRTDKFINFLPLFCAKMYPAKEWYQKDVYFTSADKGDLYQKDKDFLKSCLIYTCLSNQNKCLSIHASDKKYYRNELCLSLSSGEDYQETEADRILKQYKLNSDDNDLLEKWDEILTMIEGYDEYDDSLHYGTYQISIEINLCDKDENDNVIYKHSELNTSLNALRKMLADYYEKYIQPKLFKYELLK